MKLVRGNVSERKKQNLFWFDLVEYRVKRDEGMDASRQSVSEKEQKYLDGPR